MEVGGGESWIVMFFSVGSTTAFYISICISTPAYAAHNV